MAATPQQQSPHLRIPVAISEMCKPSDVQQISAFEWEVSSGPSLQIFVDTMGPPSITRCNLLVVKAFALNKDAKPLVIVLSHSASRSTSATSNHPHHLSDSFTLTSAGAKELGRRNRRRLADIVVARGTLYCSGESAVASRRLLAVQNSSGPNCQRKCGGFGKCRSSCDGKGLGHACQFHVTITMTISQVQSGKVTVKTAGTHVPQGIAWTPMHPLALTCSKLVKDRLVQTATTYGQTATAIVNKNAGKRVQEAIALYYFAAAILT